MVATVLVDASDIGFIYVGALVAYDGTDFFGFQDQVNVPTIQGTLERALCAFAEIDGRIVGAGRTDTGVHASGQVIAVRVRWRHDTASLGRAWNARLPDSICVRNVRLVPEHFHPRFSALWRTYRYTVRAFANEAARSNQLRRSPLTDRFALFAPRSLDLAAMQEAAQTLVGSYDFGTFGRPTQGTSTTRTVRCAQWSKSVDEPITVDGYPGVEYRFRVTANGFLRQMVRTLVGTMLDVGRGKIAPVQMQVILKSADRRQSSPPAPPQGLVLEHVEYADEFDFRA